MAYNFTVGSRVEVRSDDEGFKGAYFVATILEEPKFEQYVVVYDHLNESEDPDSRKLTEMVHISKLRPLPPPNKSEMIKLHYIVDAYYNDGWWPGEVIETLQDGKFSVYFADPPDQQIVERNYLRHHFEWANGKWKRPRRKRQISKMINQGSAVEVTFERENYNAWHIGNVLQVKGNNKFLVKYQSLGVDNKPVCIREIVEFRCIRPFPPQLEEQDFVVLDKVEVYYNLCWWSGVIHKILNDLRFVVITQANVQLICIRSHLRPRLDWIDDKWTTTSPNTKVLPNYEPLKSNRTKTLGRKLQAGKYSGTEGKKIDDAVHVDEADMHVHEELGTLSETPVKKKRKREIRDQNKESIEGSSSGIKRSRNRKSGRPQKFSPDENQIGKDNLILTTVDDEPDEDLMISCKDYMNLIVSERKIMTRLCRRNELLSKTDVSPGDNQSNKTGASTRVEKFPNEPVSDEHSEMIPNTYLAEDQVGKELLIEWHGETSETVNTQSQNQGPTTNVPAADDQDNRTVALNGATTNGNKEMNKTLESGSKAQGVLPLYRCGNATFGESDNNASSALAGKDIIQFSPQQKTVANYPTCELGTPSAIISCDDRDKNVPFFKSSPVWKSLESMEIFSKTQRKPHFSPLLKCREETREGLAIGHMITFSSVADKTLNLPFSDPSSVITNNLKTLAELEKHGFDVEPVRARSMMLLAKKEKERKLQADYEMVENEITNRELEKDKLSQEKIEINRTLKELAEKLKEIDSKEVIKDEEISTLRSTQEAIRENVRSVEHEFESAAHCPF